jgi:hypothetical protein
MHPIWTTGQKIAFALLHINLKYYSWGKRKNRALWRLKQQATTRVGRTSIITLHQLRDSRPQMTLPGSSAG